MKLPGKQVKWNDEKALKCLGVCVNYNTSKIVAKFSKTTWALTCFISSNVKGDIGGYNCLAREVSFMLARLGFWTEKSAENFNYWFDEKEKRVYAETDKRYLKELSAKYGFKLVKK